MAKTKYKAKINTMGIDAVIFHDEETGQYMAESTNGKLDQVFRLDMNMSDFFWDYVMDIPGAHENYAADKLVATYGGKVLEYSPVDDYEYKENVVY